ncbi:MAG: ABC transporter ATP-binding protein [Candidatus Promineifilaceae bacterium]
MTSISLRNLSKSYTSGTTAVDSVCLDVADGEIVALLGPSGSGKTTILRMLAGLLKPSQGDILFDGASVLGVPPEKRGAVMVFQAHSLFPFMSVGDNIAFGLRMQKLDKSLIQERVAEGLAAVQLEGFTARFPSQLSGGQQQRVALARALVIRPKLLLLDEPLSSLDQSLRADMRQLIQTLQRQYNITTLFITHDQSDAVAIADRIVLLFDGKIRQIGKPQAFYNAPADPQVARFFGGVNFFTGVKNGMTVDTAFGTLLVGPNTLPDGEVLLTIRPEAVAMDEQRVNDVVVELISAEDRGPFHLCRAQHNDTILTFHTLTKPTQQTFTLHLPPNRLWLFAAKTVGKSTPT